MNIAITVPANVLPRTETYSLEEKFQNEILSIISNNFPDWKKRLEKKRCNKWR